jgi:tetratricopeptide (TPR) repeat protein
MTAVRRAGIVLVCSLALRDARAQPPHNAHPVPIVSMADLQRPPSVTAGAGNAHDQVGTTSAEAQRLYDLGLSLLHGYEWIDAARAFHQALRADPSLAVAHAELSYAFEELNMGAEAKGAIDRARALAAGIAPHDRAHIDARAAQMDAEAAPRDPARLTAYRRRLDAALTTWPQDLEFLLQRGVAESSDPADRGQGSVLSGVPFFERAAARGSAAAHHYWSHALENANRAAAALPHAQAYARAAPQLPHALHMQGHALLRQGRAADAAEVFINAGTLASARARNGNLRAGEDWHVEHNLGLLGETYRYLGRGREAETQLRAAFDLPSASAAQLYDKRNWPEYLIARGRIDEALAAAARLEAHASPLIQATGFIESGLALLARGDVNGAAQRSNSALRALRSAADGQALVTPALSQLQGLLFMRTGQGARGRTMLDTLIADQRRRPGPDNWIRSIFLIETVSRAARAQGEWALAEATARSLIEHDPGYAGGHAALALALLHKGQRGVAQQAADRAIAGWQSANRDFPDLVEILMNFPRR